MTSAQARSIERRFLVLRALRWLPSGLLIPVMVLLMLDRGFSLAQIGLIGAAQGVAVMLLELPTGGLADALGRRPVLLIATLVELAAVALFAVAETFWL
ncbi:MAG TPA: MFS transporter, partial [Euzebyales bacterium]|nr:MFS transporter [Euzebyales bacterium]